MAHATTRDKSFYPQMSDAPHPNERRGLPGDADFVEHLQTYRGFVKGVMLFAAHVFVIVLLLYYFLA